MDKQEEFIDEFKAGLVEFELQALNLWGYNLDIPHHVINEMYKIVEKVINVLNVGVERDTITPSTRLVCLVAIYNRAEKVERKIKGEN